MSFHLGFLPYYLLVTLSIVSQIGPIKSAASSLGWGLDYPGFVTANGFVVPPAADYAIIRLLNHPAPLIVASVALTMVVLVVRGHWKHGGGVGDRSPNLHAIHRHHRRRRHDGDDGRGHGRHRPHRAAGGGCSRERPGPVFPLVSPFIGVLGSFMTGSNTNSNVLFGILQVETARSLGIGEVTIASVQSIGASVGSSMAPAKVLVGAAIAGLAGREHEIMRTVVPYILGLAALTGIEALILIQLIPSWTR